MSIKDIAKRLCLKTMVEPQAPDKAVETCYIGDLLSLAMVKAPENCAWITVMGNINAIAIAKLRDISMIILCDSALLEADAHMQALANGIAVYQTEMPAYDTAVRLYKALNQQ